MIFSDAFRRFPLVAILRGVRPADVVEIGTALADAGFTLIEVPLNSPDPFESIERLVGALAGRALVGAGTVLSARQVEEIAKVGGKLVVSPNCNPVVIAATRALGLVSLPGCFTPTEAFAAIDAGADAIKFFPAEAMSPSVIKAMCAVLPMDVPRLVVGGITPDSMQRWLDAGATGFGLGSALYRAGDTAAAVAVAANDFAAALRLAGHIADKPLG